MLKARWCEPTLSVVDVRIGDEDGSGDSAYRFGPTRFSVIPRSAVGNVSIRFVPDQNADHLIAALRYASGSLSAGKLWNAMPAQHVLQCMHITVTATLVQASSTRCCILCYYYISKQKVFQPYTNTFFAWLTIVGIQSTYVKVCK